MALSSFVWAAATAHSARLGRGVSQARPPWGGSGQGSSLENLVVQAAPKRPPGAADTHTWWPCPGTSPALDPLGVAYVCSEHFSACGPPGGKRKADGLEL